MARKSSKTNLHRAAGPRAAGETPSPISRHAATAFVGRVADRAAITERFEEGARLVTITGPGGIGKTTVALRFAEDAAATYSAPGASGVWLCDLTGARTVLGACSVIASVFGVRLQGGGHEPQIVEELGRAIARRKRVLVVLDNFEPIAEHAQAILGRFLVAAPSARFLVTSRVVLGLAGEHLWPLDALALPPAGLADAEGLRAVESVDLFVRRARQVRPDLPLAPDDLRAIAEIVRRVGGIPLAIELAAARVAVLSAAQLAERLSTPAEKRGSGSPLDLLVRRGGDARHASMRRAILDSYAQLDGAEQACFAGASVFATSFTLEAAESVLAGIGPDLSRQTPVLALLEALVARSLVRAAPCRDLGGELRFSLYETIRELAAEKLAAAPGGLGARLIERHTAYFAAWGRALVARSFAHGDPELAARLAHEIDNVLAAHANAVTGADPKRADQAISLALTADLLLTRQGLFRLRLRLLEEAVERARAAPNMDVAALARGLFARGRAHRELGALQRARADFEQALALAHESGRPALEALGHAHLGEIIEIDGATAEARAAFDRALGCLARAERDPEARRAEADLRAHMAHTHRREGALPEAAREIDAAITLYRSAHQSEGLAMALYEAGVIAIFRRSEDEALRHFREALALVEVHGPRQTEGALLAGLGVLAQERGALDEALDCHERAVHIFREVGNLHREASALYYLAGTYLERGQRADAASLLDRSLAIVRDLGVPRYEALILSCRAAIFAGAGAAGAAAEALREAERAADACRSEGALLATIAIHRLGVSAANAAGGARDAAIAEARALAEANPSDDPRFALRALLALLGVSAPSRSATGALIVREGGRAFRLPGTDQDVDLERRAPLRRLLVALGQKRLETPGEGMTMEDLLAAGWPGERMRGDAGANRVYVALTTLRNLGLRAFLMSGRDGYWLSATCPFEMG